MRGPWVRLGRAALAALALFFAPQARARPPGCEFNLPIAGSAGFANAQAARKTNVSTYGAAAFAERSAQQMGLNSMESGGAPRPWGFASAELNWTFGAARVPTLCDDPMPTSSGSYGLDPLKRWGRKERVYEQPLDLYATNVAFGFGLRRAGAFYSASVTQSVLGQRILVLPTALTNFYPAAFAPLVGAGSTGSGVGSYTVDWIGGAWLDHPLAGARVGYTGVRGFYASADERVLGLFGTLSASGKDAEGARSPVDYLRAGVEAFSVRRFGASDAADKIGMSSLFFRNLPVAASAAAGSAQSEGAGDHIRTLHAVQRGILQHGEVDLAVNLGDQAGLFEAQLGFHSAGYFADRDGIQSTPEAQPKGFLFKAGMIRLPGRYALGVPGGNFVALRAEFRAAPFSFQALFNDPEQLALFPFATNALSLRLALSSIGWGD